MSYLPSNAGAAFTTITQTADRLDSGTGALVFAAWLVVVTAAAAITLRRRDV